jgi:hypothetical protein
MDSNKFKSFDKSIFYLDRDDATNMVMPSGLIRPHGLDVYRTIRHELFFPEQAMLNITMSLHDE